MKTKIEIKDQKTKDFIIEKADEINAITKEKDRLIKKTRICIVRTQKVIFPLEGVYLIKQTQIVETGREEILIILLQCL